MFLNHTSIIIPTKDRANKIIKLLKQIKKTNIKFYEIIIVDSSVNKNEKYTIKRYIKNKKIRLYETFPSTSYQRNFGMKKVGKKSKYFLFLDDDIEIFKNTFFELELAIKKYRKIKNICSYGLNLITEEKYNFLEKIKKSKLVETAGLYSETYGKVMQNGWHTKISNVKKDIFVEWIYSGATLYDRKKIKNNKFILYNKGFNYLEDLDFSYSLTKKKLKHLVISKAKVKNYNVLQRNDFKFGYYEIINRYKFVTKFKKKKLLFFLSSFARITFLLIPFLYLRFISAPRIAGNCFAFFKCIMWNLSK